MKIDTQFLEDHQAKLIVEVETDQLEEMKRRAANRLSRRIKIPGFRPGKAPYPVVQRTVGDSSIFEEALELLVENIYPKIIKESQIDPYGPGRLEKVASVEPLILEFIVPLEAKVALGDYHSIHKPYEPKPVLDQDIENAIEELRERYAIVEPVDRPAQTGDIVTIKISAERTDKDDDTALFPQRTVQIIIRSDDSDEWPFVGFSKYLINKTAGNDGLVDYSFPEDKGSESLRGVQARFQFIVENVKSRALPELDDEFGKSIGDFDNLEALRENLRSALEAQAKAAYDEIYDAEIIEEVIGSSQFQYPPQMLENEIDQVLGDLESRLHRQGLDMDIYLKSRDKDITAIREELKPVAEKKLKHGLVLFELGKSENIKIQQEELEHQAVDTLDYLQKSLPQKDARRLTNKNVRENIFSNVLVDLMTRKTIERLRDISSGALDVAELNQPEDSTELIDRSTELVSEDLSEIPTVENNLEKG